MDLISDPFYLISVNITFLSPISLSTMSSILSSSITQEREEKTSMKELNPGAVLNISMKKQQEGKTHSLCRKVLVDNTVKSVQVELNRKIKETFLLF